MSLESHLAELTRKHGEIEREIDEALNSPSTDELQITAMKRRKLALKDEIVKIESQTRH